MQNPARPLVTDSIDTLILGRKALEKEEIYLNKKRRFSEDEPENKHEDNGGDSSRRKNSRRNGFGKYNDLVFFQAIERFLPLRQTEWIATVNYYQMVTNERKVRLVENFRHRWLRKFLNDPQNRDHKKAMAIQKKIAEHHRRNSNFVKPQELPSVQLNAQERQTSSTNQNQEERSSYSDIIEISSADSSADQRQQLSLSYNNDEKKEEQEDGDEVEWEVEEEEEEEEEEEDVVSTMTPEESLDPIKLARVEVLRKQEEGLKYLSDSLKNEKSSQFQQTLLILEFLRQFQEMAVDVAEMKAKIDLIYQRTFSTNSSSINNNTSQSEGRAKKQK